MVFSSLIFLYAFFPISLLAYWLCPTKRLQNLSLLVFSLFFYSWGEPKYVLLLMFMALISWLGALVVERSQSWKKLWVAAVAVVDIALIGCFKYAGMLWEIFAPVPEYIEKIALPIGISFYTFQLLSYVVDVYRGEAEAQRSYWNVLLYAALFHQCIAGPIVRYKTIHRELFSGRWRKPEVARGVSRFCSGLAKKVLLANPCGALADTMILSQDAITDTVLFAENLSHLSELSVLGAWLGVTAYGLHIYLDFSAYSDMAIGMGKMLGFHYLENFNYPYISRTVTEFWRRWHMSLGTFFRDYVYIPLGGNRGSRRRVFFNTLVVWALTGLWHGASWNFLLWGLWFFVFLILERSFLKKWLKKVPILSNLYLLMVVAVGWVIFRFSNLEMGWTLVQSLFGMNHNPFVDFFGTVQLQNHIFLLAAAGFTATPAIRWVKLRMENAFKERPVQWLWNGLVYSLIPVVLLLLSTANLVGESYNPFIYFQF